MPAEPLWNTAAHAPVAARPRVAPTGSRRTRPTHDAAPRPCGQVVSARCCSCDLLLRPPELVCQLTARLDRHSTNERTHAPRRAACSVPNLGLLDSTHRLLRVAHVAIQASHSAESRPAVAALLRRMAAGPTAPACRTTTRRPYVPHAPRSRVPRRCQPPRRRSVSAAGGRYRALEPGLAVSATAVQVRVGKGRQDLPRRTPCAPLVKVPGRIVRRTKLRRERPIVLLLDLIRR